MKRREYYISIEILRLKSIGIEILKSKFVGRMKRDALKAQLAPQSPVHIATIVGSSSVKVNDYH